MTLTTIKRKRQKYTLFDSIDSDDFQKVAIAYSGENQFFEREVNHANNDEWLEVYPFYTNVQKEGIKLYGTAGEGKYWGFGKQKT